MPGLRRAAALIAFTIAAGAGGCSLHGTRAAWWERDGSDPLLPNPRGGEGEAICLLVVAGAGLVVHAIGEAVEATVECVRRFGEDQHPGVPYDSPEGLALRVPHYPGR